MIHLDTSFLIHALVPASSADKQLRGWLRAEEDLGMSSVAWAEFLCGPVGADEIDLVSGILEAIAPFTAADGALAAHLFNRTGRRRGTLADCMIAAAAMAADASLATANPKDFERLAAESLRIIRTP
jgi:predicted nucleic acid-binding protein